MLLEYRGSSTRHQIADHLDAVVAHGDGHRSLTVRYEWLACIARRAQASGEKQRHQVVVDNVMLYSLHPTPHSIPDIGKSLLRRPQAIGQ